MPAAETANSAPLSSLLGPQVPLDPAASDPAEIGAKISRSSSASPPLFLRPKKSIASLYRNSRQSIDVRGFSRGTAVADSVEARLNILRLEELCGSNSTLYIPGESLKHVKRLGEGAFAEVSIAEYHGPDYAPFPSPKTVAVKRLKTPIMAYERDVVGFIEEIRVMSKIKHKNIVEFVGTGALDTTSSESEWRTIFLVQEYCDAGTLKSNILKHMVYSKSYSYSDALQWSLDVAEGLQYLHTSTPKIIHRDLKVENIFLQTSRDGKSTAKIGDLGLHAIVQPDDDTPAIKLSKRYDPISSVEDLSTPKSPSHVGQIMAEYSSIPEEELMWKMTGETGAYCYMAPEVLANKPYNEKCDVFAYGVCLYEIFSRRLIAADYMNTVEWDESMQHAQKVAAGWRPPIPKCVPDALAVLIDRCWNGEPTLRPSMGEIVKELLEIKKAGLMDELDALQAAKAKGCCCVM